MKMISRLFLQIRIQMARDSLAAAEDLHITHLATAHHAETTVIPQAKAHLSRLEAQAFAQQFPLTVGRWGGRETEGRWGYSRPTGGNQK